MTSTTDFVAELFRAANEVAILTPFARRRLVERAAATIEVQRQLLDVREKVIPLSHGVVGDLAAMRQCAGEGPDVIVCAVLLQCAEEIRRLRILALEEG